MLHYAIQTDPVNQEKHNPFFSVLFFAYHEVPNCATGMRNLNREFEHKEGYSWIERNYV